MTLFAKIPKFSTEWSSHLVIIKLLTLNMREPSKFHEISYGSLETQNGTLECSLIRRLKL